MPHSVYRLDRYFPDANQPEGVYCESRRIFAANDDEAIVEGKLRGPWQNPLWFEVRRIERNGDHVVYSSREKPVSP